MAEEKRATDRIYDHKASKKARGEEPKKKSAEATTSEDAPAEGGAAEKVAETLDEIRARHRREQEEGHKSHTKALDDMFKRHADEIDVAVGKHGTHLEAGPGVTAEEA